MAESVVSGVVSRLGDLLLQEANFLFDVSDQVEQLQTELQRMQCFLKDADARQDESELVRQWVAEIRELAYDADDIIGTYEIKVASRRGGGIQKILKRLQTYGIRASSIEGSGPSALNERQREQRQTYSGQLERDVVGFEDDLNKLVVELTKMHNEQQLQEGDSGGIEGERD